MSRQSQPGMKLIIKKTADSGPPFTCRLGFKVEALSQHPGFPEKSSVPPGAFFQGTLELGEHGHGKKRLGSNRLTATNISEQIPGIASSEKSQRDVRGDLLTGFQGKFRCQGAGNLFLHGRMAGQQITSRFHSLHLVDKKDGMNPRRPLQDVKWRNFFSGEKGIQNP